MGAPARYVSLALSTDSMQLAFDVLDVQNQRIDTWIVDLARNVSSRLTSVPSVDGYPLWATDGRRVVFASNRDGIWNLYERNLQDNPPDGTPSDRPLIESSTNKYPQGWSPDGQSLIYVDRSEATGHDLWRLPLTGDRKPVALLQTAFNETHGQVSPDGRWLAYTSDESGRLEVYVRPFSGSGGKWRVSTNIGCQPRWRADGRELFYRDPEHLMAVAIDGSSSFKPAIATPLFRMRSGRVNEVSWDWISSISRCAFLFDLRGVCLCLGPSASWRTSGTGRFKTRAQRSRHAFHSVADVVFEGHPPKFIAFLL